MQSPIMSLHATDRIMDADVHFEETEPIQLLSRGSQEEERELLVLKGAQQQLSERRQWVRSKKHLRARTGQRSRQRNRLAGGSHGRGQWPAKTRRRKRNYERGAFRACSTSDSFFSIFAVAFVKATVFV